MGHNLANARKWQRGRLNDRGCRKLKLKRNGGLTLPNVLRSWMSFGTQDAIVGQSTAEVPDDQLSCFLRE